MKGEQPQLDLCFQVAGVHKPLLSVKRVADQGNRVIFGAEGEDSFIENKATGNRIELLPMG